MNTIIDYRNICFSYKQTQILFDVSLKIKKGQSVAIVGHNGAGKTTLIKLLIGALKADSGQIITQIDSNNLGFMPESNALYNHLYGIELMQYYAKLKNISLDKIMPILKKVNIDFAANKKISAYSKGMKQRLMLAQALLSNPDVLILDEPYSGLDPSSRDLFSKIFREQKDNNKSVIFSSHTLDGLSDVVDTVIFIDKGKIVLDGNIKNIMSDLNLDSKMFLSIEKEANIDDIIQQVEPLISSYKLADNQISLFYKNQNNLKLLQILSNNPKVLDIDISKANVNNIYHHIYNQ